MRERIVWKLDFYPGGISTIVLVNDLKDSPGREKWELRQVTKRTLHLIQDNYPEFVAKQASVVTWRVRVVGWEVSYGAEFMLDDKEGYTVIIQKAKKITPKEEMVSNSLKIGEAGKIVVTIDNPTSRNKKLLYRFKTKACLD
ncbi:hypothetical protein RJ641_009869 [Dillenia turbinata]|uniref:Patellin-1-6 C-terminal GOLD domain-containing protein n=1 Tax=Dillenia turbinata TaxID=194707 RepID=A0AAN8Z265_9MAGN